MNPERTTEAMDEQAFWHRLEFRVCREMAGTRQGDLGLYWCDGFTPEIADLVARPPRISGRVWLARGGREQWAWAFNLILTPDALSDRGEVDWTRLLPPDDVTGWLSLDWAGKTMKVVPSAAYPDPIAKVG
jgi:hypothetical protein